MRKGQFYLLLSVLFVTSPLFVFKIQTSDIEDILGSGIVCFASFIVYTWLILVIGCLNG
jgi:hypothetical protein